MNIEFYDSKKRKKLLAQLNEQFGIDELPKILFETGRERVRGFSGDLTIDELYELSRLANIEFFGLYLIRIEERFIRLSFDGTDFFKGELKHHVADLDDVQLQLWMNGHNVPMELEKGIYVVRHGKDVFGCGVSDGQVLINFVPKERRIRRN